MVVAPTQRESDASPFRFDRAEMAGALGDLGVLVPIAVALIVKNGLTPTAVLLPAGLLYVVAGLIYRLPVPVQPLKAFGAIAIAHGFGADDIGRSRSHRKLRDACVGHGGQQSAAHHHAKQRRPHPSGCGRRVLCRF